MKNTLSHFWRHRPVIILSLAALVFETLCDLIQPTLLAGMIDNGVRTGDPDIVRYYTFWMLGVTGIGMCFAITRAILSSNISQRFGRDVRLAVYMQVQKLPLESVDRFERASLITRMTNDVTQVQNFLNGMMRLLLRAPILCIGAIIMAIIISPRMSMVLVVVIPVAVIILISSVKIGYPFFRKVQNSTDNLNGTVREYLSGIRVIKAFNSFQYEKQRFEERNTTLTDNTSTAMKVTAIFGPAATLAVNLGIAAVILIAGIGGEQPGTVIAFVNYMVQIMFALSVFSRIFNMMVRALASGRRIEEVLNAESDTDLSGTETIPKVKQGLEYRNVSFRYHDTSEPILENIDFSAARNESIGIIGTTGTGKSTLVHLLPRFYDVSAGSILIDGRKINEFDINKLRERIAIVPQQNVLFTGSIAANLRWGKPDATDDELWAALTCAQAADFVRGFPEGIDTLLGRGGVNVSGGQKQRIAIARAVIKQPDILILDDCTSAVDVHTEALIRSNLRSLVSDMLCIVISQRITSVMGADRIIVLDQGGIAGMGTHLELMEICEIYKDIYISQIGE